LRAVLSNIIGGTIGKRPKDKNRTAASYQLSNMGNSVFTKLIIVLLLALNVAGQDKQELEAEKAAGAKLKGEHPLVAISRSKPSSLRSELVGVHPRVYMTQDQIDKLKKKAVSQKDLWQTAVSRVRAMAVEPPPAPAQDRRVQNEVGIGNCRSSVRL
jgi:hypothetical protein